MSQVRINRSFRACTTVVIVVSIMCFWFPRPFLFDIPNALAGLLGGRIGATPFKGLVAGVAGGVVVAICYVLVAALAGWLDGLTLLRIALVPVHTTVFGVIGGVSKSSSRAKRGRPET